MGRMLVGCALGLGLIGLSGCAATPARMYQNAYGFNNPNTEYYRPGNPPPVTTPPGFLAPAVRPPPPSVTEQ